jgi:hypothetical protein
MNCCCSHHDEMNYFPAVEQVRKSFVQSSEDHYAAAATHKHMVISEEKSASEGLQQQFLIAW